MAQSNVLVTSSSFTVPKGAKNLRAQLLGSGGGGGSASVHSTFTAKAPASQADCDPYNAIFVHADINGTGKSTCITKRNVGDAGGPPIASGVQVNSSVSSASCSGKGCCWQGTTSTDCTAGSSYSGCNRTVCNQYAGHDSCAAWAPNGTQAGWWRLINKAEGKNWVTYYYDNRPGPHGEVIFAQSKLDACYSGENFKIPALQGVTLWPRTKCASVASSSYCVGGGWDNTTKVSCHANALIVEEAQDWGMYLPYDGYRVAPSAAGGGKNRAGSVRCVTEQIAGTGAYYSYSGGGGGGGARLNYTVPDSYIPAGTVISMSVGTCAAGAGGGSCVAQLSTSTNFKLQAYGGNAGGNATKSASGSGGSGSSTCRKYQGGWSNISCSASGKNGSAGTNSSGSTYVARSGGIGGNGADNNATGKGGNGGSTNSSGGTAAASSGAAGYARFYYDRYETAMLSGGGGGSGAILSNISIPQSVIDANVGGKIEIKSGKGGAGGSARNNGAAGTESYVIVKNSAGAIVWGYKALGGQGGGAASASAGGTGGAGGTCQTWNGSGWVNTSCSSNGIQGGNGTKSTDGSTPQAGAGKGSGYSASGAGSNSTDRNASSGSSSGVAKITYDRHFQAAAGGGGGGGAYAQIKGIKVIPLKTYNIRIGKGGNAGSIGTKGQDGGMSYIEFEGIRHYVSGGTGGSPGTAQSASHAVSHGAGGSYGRITTSASGVTYTNGTSGTNGISSGFNSSGGNGGTSGINSKGACGGLFLNASICQNSSVHGQTISFKLPRNINKTPSLGNAGAGGAGGGWNSSNYSQTGSGSKGLDGYVYLWWQTFK